MEIIVEVIRIVKEIIGFLWFFIFTMAIFFKGIIPEGFFKNILGAIFNPAYISHMRNVVGTVKDTIDIREKARKKKEAKKKPDTVNTTSKEKIQVEMTLENMEFNTPFGIIRAEKAKIKMEGVERLDKQEKTED